MAVEPISDMLNEFVDAWLEEEGGAHETWEALTATSSRCSKNPFYAGVYSYGKSESVHRSCRLLRSRIIGTIFDHQVVADVPGDPRGGVLDRIPGKVGVARGCLYLRVIQ